MRSADERDCRRLAPAFAGLLDLERYAEVAGLFTADGVLHRVSGEVLRGRPAITRGLRRVAGQRVIHHVSPVHLEPADGGEITGVCSFLAFAAGPEDDSTAVRVAALWHDRYRREGGAWRIACRWVEVRMSAWPIGAAEGK